MALEALRAARETDNLLNEEMTDPVPVHQYACTIFTRSLGRMLERTTFENREREREYLHCFRSYNDQNRNKRLENRICEAAYRN